MTVCLVTGARGQDGLLIAENLLSRGFDVVGLSKQDTAQDPLTSEAVAKIREHARFVPVDTDYSGFELARLFESYKPRLVFHFAAVSHTVHEKSDWSDLVVANVLITQRLLNCCMLMRDTPRFFFASSSEAIIVEPNLVTKLDVGAGRSEYGLTKRISTDLCQFYRRVYGLKVYIGFLFNHESVLRSPRFLVRKICIATALIYFGHMEKLPLGDIDAARDWGCANEYVDLIAEFVLSNSATDLEIGTGFLTDVKSIVETAFQTVGLDWTKYVYIRDNLRRIQTRNIPIVADTAGIKTLLGRAPTKGPNFFMRDIMMHDIDLVARSDGKAIEYLKTVVNG